MIFSNIIKELQRVKKEADNHQFENRIKGDDQEAEYWLGVAYGLTIAIKIAEENEM